MNTQVEIRNHILSAFHQLQKNNSRFSLRAYAKRIGVSAGALSAMLNGKRVITKKMALKFADKLSLDPQEKSEIINSFQNSATQKKNAVNYLKLTTDQFRVIADWEHFGILSLLKTKNFQSNPQWIASRLGISVIKVNQAITRLVDLKLVSKNSKGVLSRTKNNFRTSDDIVDSCLQKANDVTLDLARQSLYRDGIKDRDFSSITFAINPKKLAEAKAAIRQCQDDLALLLETAPCTEVYRFSCQLYPLSVLIGENK